MQAWLCAHLITTLTSSSLFTLGIAHASMALRSLNHNLDHRTFLRDAREATWKFFTGETSARRRLRGDNCCLPLPNVKFYRKRSTFAVKMSNFLVKGVNRFRTETTFGWTKLAYSLPLYMGKIYIKLLITDDWWHRLQYTHRSISTTYQRPAKRNHQSSVISKITCHAKLWKEKLYIYI